MLWIYPIVYLSLIHIYVGDHAFKDPFVYADDAAVAETAEVRKPENKLNAKQTTERKHTDRCV